MKNDGSALEQLVAMIEELGLPEGFRTEVRHNVLEGITGKVIAEFDILISGRIGTGDFRGLIECRDRPSEGSAPLSWIEQLVGRRQVHRLDKVMAVSTTGFAPAVVASARHAGIELRCLRDLKPAHLVPWFPQVAPTLKREGRLNRFFIAIEVSGDIGATAGFSPSVNEKIYKLGDDSEPLSTMDLWQRTLNNENTWKGVAEDGTEVPFSLDVCRGAEAVSVLVRGRLRRAGRVELAGVLSARHIPMSLVSAHEYRASGNAEDAGPPLAAVAHWEPASGAREDLRLTMIGVPPPGER